jgi:hypothetical protein
VSIIACPRIDFGAKSKSAFLGMDLVAFIASHLPFEGGQLRKMQKRLSFGVSAC